MGADREGQVRRTSDAGQFFLCPLNVGKTHARVSAEANIEPTPAWLPPQSPVVTGSFCDSTYLQLTYRSSGPSESIQAGIIVLSFIRQWRGSFRLLRRVFTNKATFCDRNTAIAEVRRLSDAGIS